jgi:uncharacterized protein
MQNRLALPLAVISIFMAGVFGVQWFHSQTRVHYLTIATGGRSGQYYAFAQALAKVVARHQPRIQIKVLETEGSLQNEKLLEEKKVELALLQSDIPSNLSTKAVSFLFPEMFHLVATKKSGIKEVNDLKGKRIALMQKGSGSYALFWILSQHYGLKPTDFKAVNLSPEQATAALNKGEVDALFRVVALGTPAIGQLLQNGSTRLIPIDQGAALQLSLPALEKNQIPKGTYNGAIPIPAEDLPVVAVRAVLVTHQDLDNTTIYEITRILYEARNELVKYNPQSAAIAPPGGARELGWSFHPGAEAYYQQDRPSFIVEYADLLGLLMSATVLGVSSFWQLRNWLQGKQKNRADRYNIEIVKLIQQIDLIEDLETLSQVRCQLYEIFEKVVMDLDKDRISPASFQSFTFPWEVALTTIRHRETLLFKGTKNGDKERWEESGTRGVKDAPDAEIERGGSVGG